MSARTVSVFSADGTEIACEVAGSGPALILIHGTADDRLGFDRVAPHLAERFTLYMMDRRGRGLSAKEGDHAYSIEREADDIAALARAIALGTRRPVDIFAHSYGALCLIDAARASAHLGRLMFYEPPPGTPSTLVERMVERTEAGDLEGVMRLQFCELQHQPPEVIDKLKSDAVRWARYLGFAGTIAREFVNARRFRLEDGEFAGYPRPVRFIVGEKSLLPLRDHTTVALRAFPTADRVTLGGQGHNALRQAPELVAQEIASFFG